MTEYILRDFASHPWRFTIETIAWIISIGCAIAVALTVPTVPWRILYPIWILGCAMYAWAAWTRGSFGMLGNYLLLTAIDIVGYTRVLIS